MKLKYYLLAMLLLSLPAIAHSKPYYIDSSRGNDSANIGSETAPFKTWDKVFSVLHKNDTVVFGAYDKPSYEQANRVMMKQSDVKRKNHWVDKGTWKQRLLYIEMKSKQAGLRTMLKFNYEILEPDADGKNKINTINTEKVVDIY